MEGKEIIDVELPTFFSEETKMTREGRTKAKKKKGRSQG
jgi:hypothetical protein